jgi:hypothetical protein
LADISERKEHSPSLGDINAEYCRKSRERKVNKLSQRMQSAYSDAAARKPSGG